jgi:hypothetical protein
MGSSLRIRLLGLKKPGDPALFGKGLTVSFFAGLMFRTVLD